MTEREEKIRQIKVTSRDCAEGMIRAGRRSCGGCYQDHWCPLPELVRIELELQSQAVAPKVQALIFAARAMVEVVRLGNQVTDFELDGIETAIDDLIPHLKETR